MAGNDDRIAHRHLPVSTSMDTPQVAIALGEAPGGAGHRAVGVAQRHHQRRTRCGLGNAPCLHVAAQEAVAVSKKTLIDRVG